MTEKKSQDKLDKADRKTELAEDRVYRRVNVTKITQSLPTPPANPKDKK